MSTSLVAQGEGPSFTDDKVLDEFRIPFGDWYDQAVDWIDVELGTPLKATEEFFAGFIDFVIEDVLLGVPWFVVVLAFFVLGWVLQNIRIGVFSAVSLTICGLMGANYWPRTMETIGYIVVAVVLCCIIGIPIGILSGRVDAFWQAVRPVLDAMQVVHSFIYMLPFIYFFGIGPVSATIVTMVFALPPVIRLTNLGIRQVPDDVVEASRAFGQSELRILKDVQLPLARPAIMTGINQTLLMSISMLGIAAIMGAGGLGRLMFQALNNQDPALSGSAGLGFFLVAVVLDRLTQRDGDSSQSLWYRMRRAWSLRAKPEALMAEIEDAADTEDPNAVVYEPFTSRELPGTLGVVAGAVLTIVSLFLTWNSGGGWYSSFTRRLDEQGTVEESGLREAGDITGESFNGLAASGGSWFGVLLAALALLAILGVVTSRMQPGQNSRWLNPDGVAVFSIAAFVVALVYVVGGPSERAVASSGIGSTVALVGTVVMVIGSLTWLMSARQEPLRPLPDRFVSAPLVAAVIALALLIGGAFSAWVFDERSETIVSDELQARIDELTAEARDPDTTPDRAVAIAIEIPVILAEAEASAKVILDGVSDEGPKVGVVLGLVGVAGVVASALAAGLGFVDHRRQWLAGTIAMGLGAGLMAFAIGYIGTLVRATDPRIVSGVGVFFTLAAGAVLANAGRSVINEFRRSRVYADPEEMVGSASSSGESVDAPPRELVGGVAAS